MTKPASLAIISSFAALVAASAIAAGTQIAAADTVYFVDQTIAGASATGSVTGTITTNGATGFRFFPGSIPIGQGPSGDIIGFDLTISVNGQTSTLMNGVNGGASFTTGGSISATPTELLFNFGNAGQFANFFTEPTATVCAPFFVVRAGPGNICGISVSTGFAAEAVPGGPIATMAGSGMVAIAVVPGPIVGAGLPGLIAALVGWSRCAASSETTRLRSCGPQYATGSRLSGG